MGWQRPDLEIGRARFLAVTARVNWCRSRLGRARIAGGAMVNVARKPGKRLDVLRKCRKGKTTKRASRGKNRAQAPSLDLTLLIAVRWEAKRHAALDAADTPRMSSSLLRNCSFYIFVANFVEALVEKYPIRQRLRQRLPTKFSAPLTFATAFS